MNVDECVCLNLVSLSYLAAPFDLRQKEGGGGTFGNAINESEESGKSITPYPMLVLNCNHVRIKLIFIINTL